MKHHYIKNVSTLLLNAEKCIGCGMCAQVCPHNVFDIMEKKAAIRDLDACMECSACVRNCPVSALHATPGVGCASAIITGFLTGTEPSCGCSDDGSGSSCC